MLLQIVQSRGGTQDAVWSTLCNQIFAEQKLDGGICKHDSRPQ